MNAETLGLGETRTKVLMIERERDDAGWLLHSVRPGKKDGEDRRRVDGRINCE